VTQPLAKGVEVAQGIAAGDLTQTITVDSHNEIGGLQQSLKDMNDSLVRIVAQVRAGTDTIYQAAGDIANGNAELSARTEAQAGALDQTAVSMRELTAIANQNADSASQANQLVQAASAVALKGGAVVSEAVDKMEAINSASSRIVDIIGVIDSIAFQTNILALNAAVEAARAGEQGRGFAVVASEVRSLAQRSASAAKEIKQLIDASVEQVGAGRALVHQAGSTMNDIVASIRQVSDIMGSIVTASAEQTAGIERVNGAMSDINTVTHQNAAMVEQASAAAKSLQDQAAHLEELVGLFKLADSGRMARRS
jgi:methyl-accepting chemotaxis protein